MRLQLIRPVASRLGKHRPRRERGNFADNRQFAFLFELFALVDSTVQHVPAQEQAERGQKHDKAKHAHLFAQARPLGKLRGLRFLNDLHLARCAAFGREVNGPVGDETADFLGAFELGSGEFQFERLIAVLRLLAPLAVDLLAQHGRHSLLAGQLLLGLRKRILPSGKNLPFRVFQVLLTQMFFGFRQVAFDLFDVVFNARALGSRCGQRSQRRLLVVHLELELGDARVFFKSRVDVGIGGAGVAALLFAKRGHFRPQNFGFDLGRDQFVLQVRKQPPRFSDRPFGGGFAATDVEDDGVVSAGLLGELLQFLAFHVDIMVANGLLLGEEFEHPLPLRIGFGRLKAHVRVDDGLHDFSRRLGIFPDE